MARGETSDLSTKALHCLLCLLSTVTHGSVPLFQAIETNSGRSLPAKTSFEKALAVLDLRNACAVSSSV